MIQAAEYDRVSSTNVVCNPKYRSTHAGCSRDLCDDISAPLPELRSSAANSDVRILRNKSLLDLRSST